MNEGRELFSGRRFLPRLLTVGRLEPFVCAGDGAVGDVVKVVGVRWRFEEVGIVDVAGGCGGGGDLVPGGAQLLVFLVFLTAFVVFAAHGVLPCGVWVVGGVLAQCVAESHNCAGQYA